MGQMQHTCEPCGANLSAETEDQLVRTTREHAQKEHQQTFSEAEVRAKIHKKHESGEHEHMKVGAGKEGSRGMTEVGERSAGGGSEGTGEGLDRRGLGSAKGPNREQRR